MTNTSPKPTSIRIFLADGTPDGLRIVEKSNWTGRAIVASRAQLARALSREELGQPGVYVLTGLTDDGASRLYVGEADILRERLKQHSSGKDFWMNLVAFTSTNEGLNKAHVRYLESRLVGLAKEANQWALDNGNCPVPPPLSEADRADAEWFLAEMLIIFPLLGIDAFEIADVQASQEQIKDSDEILYLRERGADARGREVTDGFAIFKGSKARKSEVVSIHKYLKDLRKQLLDREVLVPEESYYVFTQDYRFKSPSSAAAILVGGNANGRLAWKNKQGVDLKRIQEDRTKEADVIT